MTAPAASRDPIPALVLLGGMVTTLLVSGLMATLALDRRMQEFEAEAIRARTAVLTRVETSIALLRATAGIFTSRPGLVTVDEFATYVDRLELPLRYPGLLGIGFARVFAPGREPEVVAEMRSMGLADFRVWPDLHDGEMRTSITFLQPLDARNQAALGFDMASDPTRRRAMIRARDTGVAIATDIVELVQEIEGEKQPGFLIYLPVYTIGTPVDDAAARRARIRGFAYTPIRAGDFLSTAFVEGTRPDLDMAVYHGRVPDRAKLLYLHGDAQRLARRGVRYRAAVAGEAWTFVLASPEPVHDALFWPGFVTIVGAVISVLLALLVRGARRSGALAQRALAAERAARNEAERANRTKDEFLATLSHELRTPLNSIIGWTSLLRMPQLTEEKRRQGIDVVERNAKAQARLIEDLLDMHRIAAGKAKLEMAAVDLGAITDEALKSMRPQYEQKGVALETRSPRRPVVVHGDSARLAQVVANLLSNALKFTPRGGRVEACLDVAETSARLVVTDTGEGIAPEFMARIFERFAQADASSSRRHAGLGLGLAIVRQLVELHGGSVEAHSEGTGRGSRFVVNLPLADSDSVAAMPGAGLLAADSLRGIRVLAVDDEPDTREMMEAVLAAHGARVRVAASADQALAALREEVPDVVLSDIGMPEKDGYALIRAIRALPDDRGGAIPAAAITAFVRDEDRAAAFAAGFDVHVPKPIQAASLLRTVVDLASRSAPPPAGRD